MALHGMQSIRFALPSENAAVTVAANWPPPSLSDNCCQKPTTGLPARWLALSFSFNISGVLISCRKGQCPSLLQPAIGFELVQPADIHQQSARGIKHAVLFIVLTFVALILKLLQDHLLKICGLTCNG
jgi:inner membrane protein involved in colicin E2 resistance